MYVNSTTLLRLVIKTFFKMHTLKTACSKMTWTSHVLFSHLLKPMQHPTHSVTDKLKITHFFVE